MTDPSLQASFAQDVVLLKLVGMNPVVVHGGGPQIENALQRLGKKGEFVQGMRVTDAETMEVVQWVLAGEVQQDIVALINQAGGKAVGLTGHDGAMIHAQKLRMPDLQNPQMEHDVGQVGDIISIDPSVVKALQDDAFIPVISPVGYGADGQSSEKPVNKRASPGERRLQILQTLAQLLEKPGTERITTAALARQLQVSEAALYRHFASKAQMFEALIDFIEDTVFALINQINQAEQNPAQPDAQSAQQGRAQALRIAAMLLQFAEKNPGMTRILTGEALVLENERLQERILLFFDKFEAALRQNLRVAAAQSATPTVYANQRAALISATIQGCLLRYCRSGFKRLPTEDMAQNLQLLV
ncbi:unnamed protein product [Darwinula stevensoni]|uniref:HTH tetR-type domain-containing protein n=1 Tax=Darwinula stevensoni TaxID=69355 RepID=A0A7R9FTD3_9CRUS|nr:unnamed protein product [Darwinula stevensoni]CAG0905235.1 unnamed protein product [Darwinula stevensoni]